MKITKIIAHNFMSLKHIEVELHKGLNTFVGSSDSGKTTLCARALRFVIFNELTGDYFVRDNDQGQVDKKGFLSKEKECYVSIETDEDVVVTRKKIKNKNIYEVTDENGELFLYENFGGNIPEKVFEVLGIKKLVVDKDLVLNINIPQKKETNIIAANNGQKAKILGSFVGTNVLDAAIRECQMDIANNTTKRNIIEKDKEDLVERLEQIQNLDKRKDLLDTLEIKMNEIQIKKQRLEEIKNIIETIKIKNEEVKNLESIIVYKQFNIENDIRIRSLESNLNLLNSKYKENETIISICMSVKNKESLVKLDTLLINNAKNIFENKNKIKSIENKATALIEKLKSKKDLKNDLHSKILNIENLNKNNNYLDKEIEKRLNKIKKEKKINQIEQNILKLKEKSIKKQNIFDILEESNKKIKNNTKVALELEDILLNKNQIRIKETKIKKIEENLNILSKNYKIKVEKIEKIEEILKNLKEKEQKEQKGAPILEKMKKNTDILVQDYIENIKILGKCPLCNSKIDAAHLKNIKEEIN